MSGSKIQPIVAIGGVGGSGTRVVAQILQDAGMHIGDDLNGANDNLWFTLLFKEKSMWDKSTHELSFEFDILRSGIAGYPAPQRYDEILHEKSKESREQHNADWLKERAKTLTRAINARTQHSAWGWKEPNTHIFIDRIKLMEPRVKYIHVMRNGLDMAFSSNQNQLKLWGSRVLNRPVQFTPIDSLAYWLAVHERIEDWMKSQPTSDVMLLDFEELVRSPKEGVLQLLEFASLPVKHIDDLAKLVQRPSSIGRFRQHDLRAFSEVDIDRLRHWYDVPINSIL